MAHTFPVGQDVTGSVQLVLSTQRIVTARLTTPGRALSADELVAAGWPDERLRPDSARNRLQVALSTLRKLGLRPLLERSKGGYRLAPGVPLRRER